MFYDIVYIKINEFRSYSMCKSKATNLGRKFVISLKWNKLEGTITLQTTDKY